MPVRAVSIVNRRFGYRPHQRHERNAVDARQTDIEEHSATSSSFARPVRPMPVASAGTRYPSRSRASTNISRIAVRLLRREYADFLARQTIEPLPFLSYATCRSGKCRRRHLVLIFAIRFLRLFSFLGMTKSKQTMSVIRSVASPPKRHLEGSRRIAKPSRPRTRPFNFPQGDIRTMKETGVKPGLFYFNGGEGEIRTLGTLITFVRFRGGCLKPLDHLSVTGTGLSTARRALSLLRAGASGRGRNAAVGRRLPPPARQGPPRAGDWYVRNAARRKHRRRRPLGVARTVDEALDPRRDDRSGAHDAGLFGHVERRVGEPPYAQTARGSC